MLSASSGRRALRSGSSARSLGCSSLTAIAKYALSVTWNSQSRQGERDHEHPCRLGLVLLFSSGVSECWRSRGKLRDVCGERDREGSVLCFGNGAMCSC